jgi:hypothetical protein
VNVEMSYKSSKYLDITSFGFSVDGDCLKEIKHLINLVVTNNVQRNFEMLSVMNISGKLPVNFVTENCSQKLIKPWTTLQKLI